MIITSTKKFDKKIKKQPTKIKEEFKYRIKLFMEDSTNPKLNVHKLSGTLKGLWSFNLSGDMRIVFDRNQEGIIILIDVGSHSELYS